MAQTCKACSFVIPYTLPHNPRRRCKLPVGTCVWKRRGGRKQIRFIKWREAPSAKAWMPYARWWWLNNRGPVPAGYGVGHLDGDLANDCPDNLGLISAADKMAFYHENPERSAAQHARCGRARARSNVQRGMSARASRWMPKRWYAIDVKRRQVILWATRSRRQLARCLGGDASINGAGVSVPDGFLLVRGREIAEQFPGFTRIVPEYRAWRGGAEGIQTLCPPRLPSSREAERP